MFDQVGHKAQSFGPLTYDPANTNGRKAADAIEATCRPRGRYQMASEPRVACNELIGGTRKAMMRQIEVNLQRPSNKRVVADKKVMTATTDDAKWLQL